MTISLQTKFLLPSLGAIILGVAALVYFNSSLVNTSMETLLGQDMELMAQALERDISSDIESKLHFMAAMAVEPQVESALTGQDMAQIRRELEFYVKGMRGVLYFNVFDAKGDALVSSAPITGKVNVADRDYFRGVTSGGWARFVSKPLMSRTVGKAVVVLAVPVVRAGRTIGVVNAGVDLNYLTSEINKTKIGKNGFAFLMDKDGMYVAHPEPAKVMQTEASPPEWLRRAIAVSGATRLSVPDKDGDRLAVATLSQATGWRVVVMSSSEEMRELTAAVRTRNLLIASGMTALLVAVIWTCLRLQLLSPLTACMEFARQVSSGKLDAKLGVSQNDELGILATDLRAMVNALKTSLDDSKEAQSKATLAANDACNALNEAQQAKLQAEQARRQGVLQAVEGLKGGVDGIARGSDALLEEIEVLRRNVSGQENVTSETAAAMDEMNASAAEVAQSAHEASELAAKTRQQALRGQEVVENARKAILNVEEMAKNMAAGLESLGERAKDIGQVMTVISDIADQTNLLALNAAIEAARAGDAGRGFAVVADEVRKLAEKTMNSTNEVGQAITAIQQGTAHNVELMRGAAQAVSRAAGLAVQSGQALSEIVGLVDQTSSQVQGIAQAAGQQSTVSEEVASSVSGISRISGEIAASVNQFAKAMDEAAEHIEDLGRIIAALQDQADSQDEPRALKA